MGTMVQHLIDPAELAYSAGHYIHTDHAQTWTGSAGISYPFNGTRFSADMIYGSGLRTGFCQYQQFAPLHPGERRHLPRIQME